MQTIRAECVSALHARVANILSDAGDAITLRIHDGFAHVTASTGGQQCRLEIDLRDPDAELVLAAKLRCFVERVRHSAC